MQGLFGEAVGPACQREWAKGFHQAQAKLKDNLATNDEGTGSELKRPLAPVDRASHFTGLAFAAPGARQLSNRLKQKTCHTPALGRQADPCN